MLREVKNKHIKPRIVPFQATLSGTAASNIVDIGYGDYTLSRSGSGAGTLTSRFGYYRNGLSFFVPNALGTVAPTAGNGWYAGNNLQTSLNTNRIFTVTLDDTTATQQDGTVDGFTFGWDTPDLSISKQQRVASTQSSPRMIWGKVTGTTGAVSINAKDFTCTRVTNGKYTITFNKAFGKTPTVMVTGSGNTSTSAANCPNIGGKSASGVFVNMCAAGGTLTDGDFYIMAIGSDSRSDSGRGRMPLQNSQRKPRIVAGQVTMASGVPSITIGGTTGGADLINIIDIGTGNFSVAIAESFIREPAIFVSTTARRAEVKAYAAGVVDIKIKDNGGNDVDFDGLTNIFIIGTDTLDTF